MADCLDCLDPDCFRTFVRLVKNVWALGLPSWDQTLFPVWIGRERGLDRLDGQSWDRMDPTVVRGNIISVAANSIIKQIDCKQQIYYHNTAATIAILIDDQ